MQRRVFGVHRQQLGATACKLIQDDCAPGHQGLLIGQREVDAGVDGGKCPGQASDADGGVQDHVWCRLRQEAGRVGSLAAVVGPALRQGQEVAAETSACLA